MGVNRASGSFDHEASQLIAKLWAKKIIANLFDTSPLTSITNTNADNSGIKGTGSMVVFNKVPRITIRDQVKGGTTIWQNLETESVELNINKDKEFAFKLDNIDIFEANIPIMNQVQEGAARDLDLAIVADLINTVYVDAHAQNKGLTAGKGANVDLGVTGTPFALSKTNILEKFVDLLQIAAEQSWPKDDNWWLLLPPVFSHMVLKSDLKNASLTGDDQSLMLKRGGLGAFNRWNIFETNQYTTVSDGGFNCFNILFGHMDAVCFQSQIVDMTYFDKFEDTRGKGMRGNNVYGYKTLDSKKLGVLYCRPSA